MVDVIIIGGGPAGSSAAIRLAQLGLKIRLYEKAHFPRPKLCGGFLSPECLSDLEELGVLSAVEQAGAIPIRRVVVSSPQGRLAESDLPSQGLSLSRDSLDTILLNEARKVGVEVQEGEDGFAHKNECQWTIIAVGRHPKRQSSPRPSPLQGEGAYYGIQTFFSDVQGITDQVELDFVPGGYVGLVRQNGNRVNVCALLTQKAMRQVGPNLDNLLLSLMDQNPVLPSRLESAQRVSAWKSVGPVRMGFKQLVQGNCLYTGDAACVFDPFMGEGMAAGIRSAALLEAAFQSPCEEVSEIYRRAWKATFGRSLRWAGLLRRLSTMPAFQEALLKCLRGYEPLLPWLTQATRAHHPSNAFMEDGLAP